MNSISLSKHRMLEFLWFLVYTFPFEFPTRWCEQCALLLSLLPTIVPTLPSICATHTHTCKILSFGVNQNSQFVLFLCMLFRIKRSHKHYFDFFSPPQLSFSLEFYFLVCLVFYMYYWCTSKLSASRLNLLIFHCQFYLLGEIYSGLNFFWNRHLL